MFGLDQLISGLGQGSDPAVVLAVAVLLGLRHATDPDHLVAMSTLVASERESRIRRAGALGLAWGIWHATSLLALGLPGAFHAHVHHHGPLVHRHLHPHGNASGHEHEHRVRSPAAPYAIGVVHGIGGSAGIALLLLASIGDRFEAGAALVLVAVATAASMALLSSVWRRTSRAASR